MLRWAVARGMTATFHWHNDGAVHHLLEVLERVNPETPVARLRWSIAHLNDASQESLRRMKAMDVGWLIQNAFYFRGEAFLGQRGAEVARVSPPIVSAQRLGIIVGGGTDAHRVMDRARSSRCNGCSTARPLPASRCADRRKRRRASRRCALHARQRLVLVRGRHARLAGGGQARRPCRAEQGLPHGADRRDRRLSRCSRWSAAASSMPTGHLRGTEDKGAD